MYIFLIVLLVFFSFNLYTNYFHYKWFLLTILSGLCISTYLYQDFGPFLPLLFMYCLCSSQYVGAFNVNKHPMHPKRGLNNALASQCSKTSLASMSLFMIYLFIDTPNIISIITAIKYLAIVNIAWTLLPEFITDKLFIFKAEKGNLVKIRGFGANISVNATLLSLMAPFALVNFQDDLVLNSCILGFTLLAIIKTTAATGLGAFILSMLVYFIAAFRPEPLTVGAIVLLLVVAVLIADKYDRMEQFKRSGTLNPKRLWDLSGRMDIWKFSREIPGNRFLGMGVGAYQYVMPTKQTEAYRGEIEKELKIMAHKAVMTGKPMSQEQINACAREIMKNKQVPNSYKYIWMHSDIMQFIIEAGWIGFLLLVLAFASIVYMIFVSGNWAALAFITAYAANSATNFPNHTADSSLLVIVMLKYLVLIG